MKIKELLRIVPLFSDLEDEELELLAQASYPAHFYKGQVILMEEEEGNTLFVIERGKVKVSVQDKEGRELVLAVLGEGDFFGEMAILDGKPRSASVVALEDTLALTLRRGDFLNIIHRNPWVAVRLLEEMAKRIRKADVKMKSLALLDVTGRIVYSLLQMAEDGVRVPEGVLLPSRVTRQLIADMSGTSRETVSRTLGRLRDDGYIRISGRRIILLREEELWEHFISL